MNIKCLKMHPKAIVPVKPKEGDAGFDLASVEDVTLCPGETKKVATGLAFEPPENVWLEAKTRSGMATEGIHVLCGVIDSGYRGEIKIVLHNHGRRVYRVKPGDRIAQMVPRVLYYPVFEVVERLGRSARGANGFGSSGK